MNFKNFIILAILILSLIGCTTRLGDFTVLSTKNIEFDKFPSYVRSRDKVDGDDIAHIIIFIPTKYQVTIEDAVDEAIESVVGGVALVDVVVRYKFWWIPYIYGQQGYIVEGTVLVDPSLVKNRSSKKIVAYYDSEKKLVTNNVTDEEYDTILKRSGI